MNYVKKDGSVNMGKIGYFTKSGKRASKLRKQIITFLDSNPDAKVRLDYGGYARLTKEFADILFNKEKIGKYLGRMSYTQMHIFDRLLVQEALA